MNPTLKKLLCTLLVLIGLILQIALGWFLWASPTYPFPNWLWWVGGGIGALFLADGLSRFQPESRRLDFLIYLSLCLFMPVYGALGCLLWILYRKWRHDDIHLAEEFVDYVQSQETEDDGNRIQESSAENIIFQELSIQSYTDIMRGPNTLLKKALIGKILQEWTPNAVSLLRLALKDEVYEIRSYASTALTTIEDRMNRAIQDARRSAQGNPDDMNLKLKLAQAYINYAESGLLDNSSTIHYAGIAQDLLTENWAPMDPDHDLYIARLSLQGQAAQLTGDETNQIRAYTAILDKLPDHQETLGHMCEYYFTQRNFVALAESCKRFLEVTDTEHPLIESARLWAPQSPVETAP